MILFFAVFKDSGFKHTLCGSKWDPVNGITGGNNAFYPGRLGSSTARYGCCPANKYMSSPEGTGTFVEACSACSLTSTLNDDIVCGCTCPNGTPTVVGGTGATLCDTNTQLDCSACNTGYALSLAAAAGTASTCLPVCLPTQVLNSDKAATGSVSGVIDTSMIVTCNEGWSGSGATVCDSDKVWNPVRTCTANSCAATQVANSDKSVANSITGTYIITIFSIFFTSPLTYIFQ